MKTIMGIDPGKEGAIAVVRFKAKSNQVMALTKLPHEFDQIAKLINNTYQLYKPNLVVLEKQQAMRGQGVSSTFSIGMQYGFIYGLLIGKKLSIVHPKTWQSSIKDVIINPMTNNLTKASKQRSVSACLIRFPNTSISYKTNRGNIKWEDGKADALNMCFYGNIN